MIEMVKHQIPGSRANTYPLGPAAINVTCRLVNLLWNQNGEIREDHSYIWSFLSSIENFYQMFCEGKNHLRDFKFNCFFNLFSDF